MGSLSVYLDTSVLVALFLDDAFSERADLAFRARAFRYSSAIWRGRNSRRR